MKTKPTIEDLLSIEGEQLKSLEKARSSLAARCDDSTQLEAAILQELGAQDIILAWLNDELKRIEESMLAMGTLDRPTVEAIKPYDSTEEQTTEEIYSKLSSNHNQCLAQLGSSYDATKERLRQVQQRVLHLNVTLRDIRITLGLTRELYDQYTTDIRVVQERAKRLRATLFHSQRMPTLVLRQIFFEVIEDLHARPDSAFENFTSRNHGNSVLAFAAVCRNWREVTHWSPSLWSRVYLSNDLSVERTQAKLRYYARQAQTISLDLLIHIVRLDVQNWYPSLEGLIHSLNVNRLSIVADSSNYWSPRVLQLPASALLYNLEVDELEPGEINSLTVSNCIIDAALGRESITRVEVHDTEFDAFPTFLLACPNLQELKLVGSNFDHTFDNLTTNPNPWPNLQMLEINCRQLTTRSNQFRHFWRLLSSIRCLSVIWPLLHPSRHSDSLNLIFTDSNIPEFELRGKNSANNMTNNSLEEIYLYKLLQVLSGVTVLRLYEDYIDITLACLRSNAITAESKDDLIFPDLQTLAIERPVKFVQDIAGLNWLRSSIYEGAPIIELVEAP